MSPMREVDNSFEHKHRLGEVTLAQRPKAHRPIRQDTTIGVIGSLSNLHSFLSECSPLDEGTTLGQGGGEVAAGGRRE
jgi:hypothetical protein